MRFYKPMLAKSVSKPFSGKDWLFEIKWDGFRGSGVRPERSSDVVLTN